MNNLLSTTRFFKVKRCILRSCGFIIGNNTKIVGPLLIGTVAKLRIGNDCWIGGRLTIAGNGTVIIESSCDLATDILIVTGSHNIGTPLRRAGEGVDYTIKIENGCWIGARVTIVGDVSIAEGAVCGTSSLIIRNVPQNTVFAGVPGRVIKNIY